VSATPEPLERLRGFYSLLNNILARACIVKRKMFLTSWSSKYKLGSMGKGKPKKNPHAVALAKLGASKGGKARAAKLTPEERQEIARKAVLVRWAKAGQRKGTPE
jgi:hypothetical protein